MSQEKANRTSQRHPFERVVKLIGDNWTLQIVRALSLNRSLTFTELLAATRRISTKHTVTPAPSTCFPATCHCESEQGRRTKDVLLAYRDRCGTATGHPFNRTLGQEVFGDDEGVAHMQMNSNDLKDFPLPKRHAVASIHERTLMKLIGRTILITGGSAGIGLAFALKFLELGNQVIVTGRRQAALDELKAKYPKLRIIQSDVADAAQVGALARRVKADYPKLDVLMNNAGIMLHKNLKVPAADLDGLMAEVDINLGGVVRMTSAFIDILTANKGTLINVSSALAFVPLSSAPIYCATKSAVHAYTQSLRFQLEDTGVEVIELMPPGVKTAMTADLPEGGGVTLIATDDLIKQAFAAFKAGKLEIRPGQANLLALMRRLAPGFINRQLWKASKNLVPVEA